MKARSPRILGILPAIVPWALGALVPVLFVTSWLASARSELAVWQPGRAETAVAAVAEENYCNAHLKRIVRRVAGACGLLGGDDRGCRPADAQKGVELSDEDFNALFLPMRERVSILQFDQGKSELDAAAMGHVEAAWADRRGASFFFVVARASPEGSTAANQALSEARARGVLEHLEGRFNDPDIRKQVGLLWLGEEFAQLDAAFCDWRRSRGNEPCTPADINRSAFIAWIDCSI
jgi:outer membrane protein OmpA-like peptidoglycan-associated protein